MEVSATNSETAIAPPPPTYQSLPHLPHPNSLFQPSPFLLSEAQSSLAALAQLKADLQAGTIPLGVLPPTDTTGIPLPEIPVPFVPQSRKRSSVPTLKTTVKPIVKPDIPREFMGGVDVGGEVSLEEYIQEWNASQEKSTVEKSSEKGEAAAAAASAIIKASLSRDRECLLFELGKERKYGSIWVILEGQDNFEEGETGTTQIKVAQVKCFAPGESKSIPAVHSTTISGPHFSLSKHLTSLQLSLPELLFRLPAIPSLLTSPCIYCSKMFRPPDGLPLQHTGYLEPPRRSKRAKSDDLKSTEQEPGRWINWHANCDV